MNRLRAFQSLSPWRSNTRLPVFAIPASLSRTPALLIVDQNARILLGPLRSAFIPPRWSAP
ncbi:Uncharacterised protein [Mycobacterium tuberculosis]|nr:Uncharacterised protein [Mycobacterium tuberculosis]